MNDRIRVGIRGPHGLLGSRLILALARTNDMKYVLGIARNDNTLKEALRGMESLPERIRDSCLPERMYLDGTKADIEGVNSGQRVVRYETVESLNLTDNCDVLVDATSQGRYKLWLSRYLEFKKPVIVQIGNGDLDWKINLASPPLIQRQQPQQELQNLTRIGDCVLSGLIPVLGPLEQFIKTAIMHIHTQRTAPLSEVTLYTDQIGSATYYPDKLAAFYAQTIGSLLPGMDFDIIGVSQNSEISHYTVALMLQMKDAMNGADVAEILSREPRLSIQPKLNSTYEIARYQREVMNRAGMEMPPITVSGNELEIRNRISHTETQRIRLRVSIDYRYVAVLPIIDAIRMLILGMGGRESMKITDEQQGFSNPLKCR